MHGRLVRGVAPLGSEASVPLLATTGALDHSGGASVVHGAIAPTLENSLKISLIFYTKFFNTTQNLSMVGVLCESA
jgi:hypothetical protein